ncbi:MAG: ccmH [Gammaproteobacteria bacterium]|jgi:cytochrome c-type biogenesis protein CcmH|nr:ccmH [Gammaproteobacteria bacterium]
MKKIVLLLGTIIASFHLFAAEDDYPFTEPSQQAQFQNLTTQLRCLVCQNENLAESNAKLAVDLRHQIYKKILEGQSNPDIIHYLVTRYGDYILYRPPFNKFTLGLWVGPFLFLFLGIAYLIYYLIKIK